MKAINLTPHTINLHKEDGTVIEIPSSGTIRLKEKVSDPIYPFVVVKSFENPEVIYRDEVKVVEITPEDPDTLIIIVSSIALDIVKEIDLPEEIQKFTRKIVVAPDTGPNSVIRDENGRIVGVKRFYFKN